MQIDDRINNIILRALEPCEVKVSCTVLRGERESNLPYLLDHSPLFKKCISLYKHSEEPSQLTNFGDFK
jgi:hypothetical protein